MNSGSSGGLGILGGGGAPATSVEPDWVSVVDEGNPAFSGFFFREDDPRNPPEPYEFGEVAYCFQVSEAETTNAQYAVFLNAVADADLYELYNSGMASGFGGIARSGCAGSYTYSAIAGRENKPVNFVSFYDTLRFANWLHNGQPTGAQGNPTTEDGAYTLEHEPNPSSCGPPPPPRGFSPPGEPSNWCDVERNVGAEVFLTSEDEWFKAAYYDKDKPVSPQYFFQPTDTDSLPICMEPGTTANTYNCDNVVGDLTDVGSYTGTASKYGTFDQGGNVFEWNEVVIDDVFRGVRGGDFDFFSSDIPNRFEDVEVIGDVDVGDNNDDDITHILLTRRLELDPASEGHDVGFRVASPVACPP